MLPSPAPRALALLVALAAGPAALVPAPVRAQTAPAPAAPAAPAAPVAPGAPGGSGQPVPPPGVTPPPPASPALPALVEKPGDPSDVDEVQLPAKPAAILPGRSSWEEAVPSLKAALKQIADDLAKAGLKPAGRPLAVFTRTDDDGFQYEAMVPLAAAPDPAPAGLTDGLRFGTTPGGKALRFTHKGSYDDIDSTYETITAYLDAKGVLVQDSFVEEYLTDLATGQDALDINIYALPR